MSLAPSYTTPQEVEDLQLRVSLSSSAGRINLWPNAKGDGFKLHTKVDGLGVADSVNTMTSLPSGGAVLRHQRLKEGDMFLPIQIRSNSKKARNDLKTSLEQILTPAKGPVKVEVMDPYSKDTRSRTTYYRTGLGAPDWSGPNSALYGITLDYAEPWWRGAVRGRKIKVADRKKPFITARNIRPAEGATVHREDRDPTSGDAGVEGDVWMVGENAKPAEVLRRNLVTNPSLEANADGWNPYWWTGSGERVKGNALAGDWFYRLTATSTLTGTKGRYIDHHTEVKEGDVWTLSIFVRPSRTISMQAQGEFRGSRGVVGSPSQVGPLTECVAGQWTRIHLTMTAPGDATIIRHQTYLHDATLQAGDTLDLDAEMIALGQLAPYFDGDAKPTGGKHYRYADDGTSEEYLPATNFKPTARYVHDGSGWVKQQPNPAIPFFPVFVYSSVVEGVYTLDIEGDEESWPTWEIEGPGTDVLIENMTTGEVLFIEGEIFEKITIVTDPQLQDIYSDTWADGQWWDRVDIKQGALFPLKAGENKIKVTMVGATQASYVKYSYEEIWGAPY